jgi:hypothetical protein
VGGLQLRLAVEDPDLVGKDDRLDALAEAELLEDVRDVRLPVVSLM